MINTIPLIAAILKGFVRNWKSILLLIVFPLMLIGTVFFSFNPNGLQKIPIGIVSQVDGFNLEEYQDTYLSYLYLQKYYTVDKCISALKVYKEYVCIEVINESSAFLLNIYYDNTREPVIWEIIERIKATIDLLQKQKSKETAAGFLTKFNTNLNKLENFKGNLVSTNTKLDTYISGADSAIQLSSTAKSEASTAIKSMDSELNNMKTLRKNIDSKKKVYSDDTIIRVRAVDSLSSTVPNASSRQLTHLSYIKDENTQIKNQLNVYNEQTDRYLADFDNKIRLYELASSAGKQQLTTIDSGITKLNEIKNELQSYRNKISNAETEIINIQSEFDSIKKLDPESLVNPIVLRNKPTYVPEVSKQQLAAFTGPNQAKNIVKGVSLISLQTIFPTILFLIALFLSLLISSFICLAEINSPVSQRIKLVKRIFLHQLLSVYISTLIIMIVPLFSVILLGDFLFKIAILANIKIVLVVLFLVSSIFIFLGMSLAYLIKKESITLLVTAFILVFLIFFSGFLLPIERMSNVASVLAANFPAKMGLAAFNKVVFYNQGFEAISHNIFVLSAWFLSLMIITLIIKKTKNI